MSETEKPDVPPPRYMQCIGGGQRLVTDEQEWLARPAAWGIGYLPESRRGGQHQLFEHHYYGRLAGWIACPVCRQLVVKAFSEEGLREPELFAHAPTNRREARKWFQDWYAEQHPAGRCDAWDGVRSMSLYSFGVCTQTELHHNLIQNLLEIRDHLGRKGRTTRFRKKSEAWARELALELVGPNPFRPVTLDAEWRSDTALSLARHIYEARDFSTMPVLADALQDAGCDNADILNHCRDPKQVHVRGCWVVDLVLGKV